MNSFDGLMDFLWLMITIAVIVTIAGRADKL